MRMTEGGGNQKEVGKKDESTRRRQNKNLKKIIRDGRK